MFRIIGPKGKDLCDAHLRPSRRDVLRVGGAGVLGLSLGSLLKLQAVQAGAQPAAAIGGGPGWGRAKSVLMVYLQGGPSHLDLWDPKPDCAGKHPQHFQEHWHQAAGRQFYRDSAEARAAQRPVHDHPLDELYAERALQPYGRHLPDDDGLHDR